jgi:putative ABC transport system permease protein
LLERVLDGADRDAILGDLHEEYARRVADVGRSRATAWYRGQLVGSVWPSVRRRFARLGEPHSEQGLRRWPAMLDALRSDSRVAFRGLLRRPGYAIVGVITLSIAIGANAAMFGVLDAVLLKALPYPDANRIVLVSELHEERLQDLGWSSVPNLLDWQEEARSFEALGLFRGRSMSLTGDGDPAYAYGAFVTPEFFAVFGTSTVLGRVVGNDDGGAGSEPVVVIGHGLWQRRFGADASVLGRTLVVDGIARSIVGVMPASYTAPNEWIGAPFPLDVWVPFVIDTVAQPRGSRSYNVVGRLRDGVEFASASAEMATIGARLSRAYPEANQGWTIRLDSWRDSAVGDVRATLLLVAGAMALVLFVACANVGNLALNRTLGRRAEFAVRSALGAGAARVARIAVIESFLVTAAACAVGLILARVLVGLLVTLEPGNLPRMASAAIDVRVGIVTLAMGVMVGVLVAAIPVLQARRADPGRILGAAGRTAGAGRGWRRFRDALAVAQLSLGLALLTGSALVAQAFDRLRSVTPGFEADGVLTATVALSWDRVPTIERRVAFIEAVLERLRALPGVESAAMINSLPFSGSHQQQTFAIAGEVVQPDREPFAALRGVSPDYIRTMRIPLRGREFVAADLAGRPSVALVNDAFVSRYLPGRGAIGTYLVLQGGELQTEIVGVVGDLRHYGLSQPARPEIYVPLTADFLTSKSFVIRTNGDPYALAASVGRTIHDLDPEQPLRSVENGRGVANTISMADLIGASVAAPRFHSVILLLLAAVAVLLAAIGLFAVVSQAVSERTREIGVRVALGAERGRLIGWVLSWSGRIAMTGIALGLLLTLAAGRVLEALLFGANARDPAVLAGSVLSLLAIATLATLVPAARATRVDPAVVLREP